ncbi:MAG TPA: NAD(P)-dependent oxidoreductase [Bacteroidia bacterium]|nr:NAD(P)-dependent oxidoreductase [Bacteroidia bacterium]
MASVLFLDTNHPLMITMLREKGYEIREEYAASRDEVMKMIPSFDAIVIRSRFKIDREFIDAGKKLKCIGRVGAGMENIDVAYAEGKGIRCLHAPEGNRDAVGEHATGMLLALMNNLLRADREVRGGKWNRESNRGYELQGKTVGIIGYGNMGSAFAQRLRGFGVKILAYDKYKNGFGDAFVNESSLEEIFAEADVVSLHLPLTEETFHLCDEKFFASFRKPVWFVNTARGKNVKTEALVQALENGKVKGACLDVLEYESVSFEAIDPKTLPPAFHYLVHSEKVILSPHIAGWTFESHEKLAKFLAEKMIAVLG